MFKHFLIVCLFFYSSTQGMEFNTIQLTKSDDQNSYKLLNTVIDLCNAQSHDNDYAIDKILKPLSSDLAQLTDLKNAASALKIDWLNKLVGRHIENHCIARCIQDDSLKDIANQVAKYVIGDQHDFKHCLALCGCEKITRINGMIKLIIENTVLYKKTSDKKLYVYNISNNTYSQKIPESAESFGFQLSDDQKKIALDPFGRCKIVELDTGIQTKVFDLDNCESIAWHKDSQQLFILDINTIYLYDIQTQMPNIFMNIAPSIETRYGRIAVNSDGSYLILCTKKADYIISIQDKAIIKTFDSHINTRWWLAKNVYWVDNDRIIIKEGVIDGNMCTLMINSDSGELLRTITNYSSLRLSKDGKRLTYRASKDLYVMDIHDWNYIIKLKDEILPPFSCNTGLNYDGTQISIAQYDNSWVCIYDLNLYERIKHRLDHTISCPQAMFLLALYKGRNGELSMDITDETRAIYASFGNDEVGKAIQKGINDFLGPD